MSEGRKLPWAEAYQIAERLAAELAPVSERVKAAGSLRRKMPEVGDIEFVVEPRTRPVDLFGGRGPDVDPIRAIVSTWGEWVKGGEKMMQVRLPEGIPAELYIVTPPAQWGSILAIRTGPKELSEYAVTQMKRRGMKHIGGHVEDRQGRQITTATEEEFFRLAGLPCLPPPQRKAPR